MTSASLLMLVIGWTLAGFFSGICIGIFLERDSKK